MTAPPARTNEEREKWMPSTTAIYNATTNDSRFGTDQVAALIRRAARDRAVEELETLARYPSIWSAATGQWGSPNSTIESRLAALRAEQEGADHD